MNNEKIIIIRSRIIFLMILIFGIIIVLKLAHIQIIQGNKWRKRAAALNLEYRPIKAIRGNIYSNDNDLLATSLPYYKVAIDPSVIDKNTFDENIEALSIKLSNYFQDKTPAYYKETIEKAREIKRRYLILNKKKIDHNDKKEMSKWPIFNKGRNRGGVIFEKIEIRLKPFKNLASRTIGHVNENNKGAGLEFTYNKHLEGKDGEALFQKTIGGWKMIQSTSEMKPTDGYDIETTIDTNIQDISQKCLKDALIESDADYGCVLIMEVKTGEIKAMVNLTRVDEGKYYETYNYTIGKQRDPGSTFKIISMMALLDKTNLKLTDEIDTGEGIYKYYDKEIRDWTHRKGGFGVLSVQDIIEWSSNIGIALLVENSFGHNPYVFVDYIHNLGITKPLGFQMLGEAKPVIKNPKDKSWSGLTLAWMSHGYEIEFAPIHILTLYNAIANNGKMIKPIIVKKIKSRNQTIKTYQTSTVKRKICSDNTLKKIKFLLEGVVSRGAAKGIKKGIYSIAGKSGTAQRHYGGKYTNSWYVSFVGYFPTENPKYSCIVAVDNPKREKQYGSVMAAPILRKIADKIAIRDLDFYKKIENKHTENENIKNVSLPRIRGGFKNDLIYLCKKLNIYSKNPPENSEWLRTKVDDENNLSWIPNLKVSKNQIPSIIGLTIKDAIYLLEKNGINFELEGKGNRISNQSLLPGTKIDEFTKLTIELK